jgi:CheY-like chemotaxis protein
MADHGSIAHTLRRHWNAEVQGADSTGDALKLLRQETFDLVLVNRVFDADGSSGVRFIQELKADEVLRPIAVMLVSNYDDAQRDAVQAGALPGFGKAALGEPSMVARVQAVLGSDGTPA